MSILTLLENHFLNSYKTCAYVSAELILVVMESYAYNYNVNTIVSIISRNIFVGRSRGVVVSVSDSCTDNPGSMPGPGK